LEYANSVRNQHRQGLIKDLEKVQIRATKLVFTVKYLTYKEMLQQLKLRTLKYRRARGDMISRQIWHQCYFQLWKTSRL